MNTVTDWCIAFGVGGMLGVLTLPWSYGFARGPLEHMAVWLLAWPFLLAHFALKGLKSYVHQWFDFYDHLRLIQMRSRAIDRHEQVEEPFVDTTPPVGVRPPTEDLSNAPRDQVGWQLIDESSTPVFDGERFIGEAQLHKGRLQVWTPTGRSDAVELGGQNFESTAVRLLKDLHATQSPPGTKCHWDGEKFMCE